MKHFSLCRKLKHSCIVYFFGTVYAPCMMMNMVICLLLLIQASTGKFYNMMKKMIVSLYVISCGGKISLE